MLSTILRHERAVVLGALLGVTLLAWGYLLTGAGMNPAGMDMAGEDMAGMDAGGGSMPMMPPHWTFGYASMMFLMWAIMMVAMMLPGAAPAVLLAAALMRQHGGSARFGPTGLFVAGYLVIWFGFSLIAALLQWGLDRAGLLSAHMTSLSVALSGGLLIATGLYQLTPWKRACLIQCRSPFELLIRYWNRGRLGPMQAGARHGLFCLGCCWMFMALLFVGGVMNILWISGLAVVVALEKLLPAGPRVSQVIGVLLLLAGAAVLVG
jgi:predicted metal-binding membrane protein